MSKSYERLVKPSYIKYLLENVAGATNPQGIEELAEKFAAAYQTLQAVKELASRLHSMHDTHGEVDRDNMAEILEQSGVWLTCAYCLGVVHSRDPENPYTGHEDDCVYKELKKAFGLRAW